MKRGPIPLSHVVLRVLTIAITLVVGLKVGPQLAAGAVSTPMVGNAAENALEDSFTVGTRIERRASPTHFFERLLAARPSCHRGVVSRPDEGLALAGAAFESRPQGERLPIQKHVPRMERGDPPRT